MLEVGAVHLVDERTAKVTRFDTGVASPGARAAPGKNPSLGRIPDTAPEPIMDRGIEAGTAWGIRMFGLDFAAGPAAGILAATALQSSDGPRLVVTANMDHIVLLAENDAFRRAYDGAAARTLDGMPLVWLARLRGQPAARVTGHDLLAHALFAGPAGQRVFLVCSRDAVADAIRDRLVRAGYDPAAVATCVPPFGFVDDVEYGRALAARIREHGTTLLVMGVGAPRSEIWVTRQGAALGTPIVLAVGEAVNVAAGLVRRAPVVLQRAGLEWAFRFALSPRRLFHRYFVRSWRFLALVRRELKERDAAA